MRRKLNVKWLACTLVLGALLGGSVHWLHGFQVQRNAGSLLEQADQAEKRGDFAAAQTYLARYVALAPADTAALARYGLLLESQAKKGNDHLAAFFVLEKVLRQEPNRHDVRRRLVHLALALHRPTDARDHVTLLLQAFPDDAELEDLLGQAEEAGTQFARAAECYGRAVQHDPGRVECFVRLAALQRRRLDKPEEADKVMDQLIEANPKSVAAYLARARYRRQFHTAALAAEDADHLRQHLAPDDADVLLLAADLDLARNRIEAARAHLKHGMDKHPDNVRLVQTMARLELQAGHRTEAAQYARRTLPSLGDDSQALWHAVDLLIDVGEFAEARVLLPRLEKSGVAPALREYLQARLCVAEEKWAEARRLLERSRTGLASMPDIQLQAYMLLAFCQQRLGNLDQQVAAYRGALAIEPTWLPARLGLAAAAAAAGQTDEAIALYRKMGERTPAARLPALRLSVVRQLRLPAARRDWTECERAWQDLPKEQRESLDGRLLRVYLLLGQERWKEARASLEAARDEQPRELAYRIALSGLAARQQRFDEAAALLDQAERDLGDSVELRLARAVPLGKHSREETHALLSRLGEKADPFGRDDQSRLLRGLMRAAQFGGDLVLAREFGQRLAALQPGDLDVRLSLFRLARLERDAPASQRWLKDIRQIEGEDGNLWRYAEAAHRVRFAAADDKESLAAARTRLTEVSHSRPNWALLALLDAELCEREGNVDGAIDQYRQAVALGERQPQVVRQVVQLLHERRRYADAQEVLRKLQEQEPLSADLGRLATEVSLLSQQAPERTLDLARQAAATDADNSRNQVWLGQVLAALNRQEEAEKAFRRAVALKADGPDTWVALVLFLAQTKQRPAAEKALAEAEAKLGKAWTPSLRGVCWEALGETDKARAQYRAALEAQPKDPGVRQTCIAFALRTGQQAEAQAQLRRLLDDSDAEGTKVWARRQLALSLTTGGSYAQFKEALALIEQNLQRPRPAAEDQRARAIVLAMQPSRRRESITALEQSFARLPANPAEQFLLAQLYAADGNWPKSRSQMLDLLAATESKNPLFLAWFVGKLLEQRQPDDAEFWLTRLAKLEPASWRTIQATARLRAQQGRANEAVRLLKKVAEKPEGDVVLAVAALLEELDQQPAAEELYRQYAKTSKRPESPLLLASYLARHGQRTEALDLCEKAAKQGSPESVAMIFAGVARLPDVQAAELKRIERWLTTAQTQKPESVGLLLALADLRDGQGRVVEAQALYRKVLQREPHNATACNNLAVLLALQKQSKEALELSQRVLDREGPVAFFLDTRGLAHLAANQEKQAVRDLEDAVALHPSAPRYFHLVQAYRALQDRSAADAAWAKAKRLGLGAGRLHPLERPAYETLAAEYEPK